MNKFFSRLIIPQESNNHKALLLRPYFLTLFIAIYLLNQQLIHSLSLIKPGILGYSSEITQEKVFDLTNQERLTQGLSQLKYNPVLSLSAQKKAQDMFDNNYWAHNSPQGKTPWDFFTAAGYQYSVAGENLAKDFYNTDSVVKAWMKSPTHRDNILNPKYEEIGIGVVNGILNGIKTTLVVQHFGTPIAASITTPEVSQDSVVPETVTVPQPEYVTQDFSSPVLSATKPLISPLVLSKAIGGVLFAIIVSVLFIDGYLTLKNKTHRFSSSNAGHIGFLAIIFLLMIFSRSGNIF